MSARHVKAGASKQESSQQADKEMVGRMGRVRVRHIQNTGCRYGGGGRRR